MAAKKHEYTYAMVMALKEDAFKSLIKAEKATEWAEEALTRTEERRTYPRKKLYDNAGNKIMAISEKTGKMYHKSVADKSRPPKITYSEISFMGLKKAFCEEVLGIEPVEQTKKPTFRDRLLKDFADNAL